MGLRLINILRNIIGQIKREGGYNPLGVQVEG